MDKEDMGVMCVYITYTYIHIHSGMLLGHKKNKILPFTTRMDLESTVGLEQTGVNLYITYSWSSIFMVPLHLWIQLCSSVVLIIEIYPA